MGGEVYIRNNDYVATEVFSVDTNAYASGDLIADTQELSDVGYRKGQVLILKSIHLLDKADQKVALYFVFLSAATSLGTENSAPTISDANSDNVLAIVPMAATDYVDLGGTAYGTKECSVSLKLPAGSTSLWVAIVNATGTPTYGAADLTGRFAFLR
jgi:hypothetical protein